MAMYKSTKKRRTICFATAGLLMLLGGATFSSCNIEMIKEGGYSEARYEVATDFTEIEINSEGGLDFTLSYGKNFSVTYVESDQEKFCFSNSDGKLTVTQRKETATALIGYKSKKLEITVPEENKLSSVSAKVDGSVNCSITGDYGELFFNCNGLIDALFVGTADTLTIDCDGAMTLNGADFSAESVRLDSDGALDFKVGCSVSLYVSCDGMCNGIYYGDPIVEKHVSGLGEIKKGEN